MDYVYMNPSRPNSPTVTGNGHHPSQHKHVTDVYNLIISESFLVKQKYNDLLEKYNELLCEYKKLYSATNSNSDNIGSGILNYMQNKDELAEQVSEKALPNNPSNGNPTSPYYNKPGTNITFIPTPNHPPVINPNPKPPPKPHPVPVYPPVAKTILPRPPIPNIPIPQHPPTHHPKEFEMAEDKDFEINEKGRFGRHGHYGHHGHHFGRYGGHYGGFYPILPPVYPYPYY